MLPYHMASRVEFRSLIQSSSSGARRPRILYLTFRFPYPLYGGDRLKTYHLLRHLHEYADVDLIALDEWHSASGENLQPIEELCSSVTIVPFSRKAGLARAVLSAPTRTPAEIAFYDSPAMQQAVDKALARRTYDLIICFFLRTAIYVRDVYDTPKLLIAEDSRILHENRAAHFPEASLEYIVRRLDAGKLKRYEPEMMRHFDMVTFVADPDRDLITGLAPDLPTDIISNGVDLHTYQYHTDKKEPLLFFIGVLHTKHNRRMAHRIVEKIFPIIRRSSNANLIIAGNNPQDDLLLAMRKNPSATLLADISKQEALRLYERASIFIHPQDYGSGIQNKLLEAMATGCAVVTTTIGASGIRGMVDGVNCLIRDTDEEIAEACLCLLNDESLRRKLADAGRALIERQYAWENVFADLDRIVGSLVPEYRESVAASLERSNVVAGIE